MSLGVIDVDLRRRAFADELGIAAKIALGASQKRLIASEVALRLGELGLERAGVEGDQEIALLDIGAVAEVNADDFVVDAAP